jgi:hypothetical protein
MTDFTDLSSLYDYLELHAQDYTTAIEIGQLFNRLAGTLKSSGNELDAEKAQWEMDFFFVMFFDGEARPSRSMYNDKGECLEYPDLKKCDERQLAYLIQRHEAVKNPVMKSRYSHILWCSPKKHGKYAQVAVDNYLLLIKIYEDKDKEHPEEHFGLNALDSFKNAYNLAIIIHYKFDDIKSELKRLVTSFNPQSSSSPALRTQLLELALNDKKIFSKEDLASFDALCEEIAAAWISRDNIRPAIDIYEIAERWEMKTSGKNSGIWRRKIAESYESMMRNRLEKGDVAVALDFCVDAILNYKIIKANDKVKELEQIYQQNKDKVEFKEFTQEIDIREHVQNCKDFAKDLIQHNSSEQIIGFLASDENYLLPKMQVVSERAKEINKTSLLHQIFPITTTDQQSNPAQTFSTDDERFNHSILEQYRMELEVNKRILMREIIFSAIREGKFTTKDIMDFLRKNSWAGKTYLKKTGTHQIPYTWISLLAPAIDDYINQINSYFNNNEHIPNLILCIDSLTLKIEGLLRGFFTHQNISTSTFRQDGIVREKDLNELFADPKMMEFFSEDELKFMRFLLIEQTGYNLRHRVAHSFMISQQYAIDYMNYLIIAMLRICQYDFRHEPKPDEKVNERFQATRSPANAPVGSVNLVRDHEAC